MNVAPSILSADFANLERDIRMVEKAGARWLHVDVMDGHFVPNITIGPPVVKSMRRITRLFLDVHLMIENPEKYIPVFALAGADSVTVHVEAVKNYRRIIDCARQNGVRIGFSIKPKTPAQKVFSLLKEIDLVLVMSVEPGFGGQKFMPAVLPKVSILREKIDMMKKKIHLEIDGGINLKTACHAVNAGADVLVAGNAIFSARNPHRMFKKLSHLTCTK